MHEYQNLIAETEVSSLGDQLVSQLYTIEIQEAIQIAVTTHNQQSYITLFIENNIWSESGFSCKLVSIYLEVFCCVVYV